MLIFSLLAVAGRAYPATVELSGTIFFDKSLGIASDSDISYGSIRPAVNQRVLITPHGEISVGDAEAVVASGGSHPGRIAIEDGRDQQFRLIADNYMSDGKIQPLKAICSFGKVKSVPCNDIQSLKGPDMEFLHLGMVIKVLKNEAGEEPREFPSFNLSVIYF